MSKLQGIVTDDLKYRKDEKFPDWYLIPGFSEVLVKPDGSFLNPRTGNEVKIYDRSDGYMGVASTFDNKTKYFYVHRLLGLAFLTKAPRHFDIPYHLLEINHIDGNKSNNALDNLEWLTPTENQLHAMGYGLKTDNFPVLAMDIRNLRVSKYISIGSVCKELNLGQRKFIKHLKSNKAGLLTVGWMVFKLDDGKPWPRISDEFWGEDTYYAAYGVWSATNLTTKQTIIHNTSPELAKLVGVPVSGLQFHFKSNGHSAPYHGWLFTYIEHPDKTLRDQLPTRKTPEGYREAFKIQYTHPDGRVEVFPSLNKAATALGTSPANFRNNMLKTGTYLQGTIEKLAA